MPKIEIDTCSATPNYCALEAIILAMRSNYSQRLNRDYKHETVITVESGRELRVIETPLEMSSKSLCDCKYRVEEV